MEAAGIPSAEVTETAYKSLIEFGVVGAVLAIILIAMLGIVWWSLLTSRRRDKEHQGQMTNKDEAHRDAMLALSSTHRDERKEDKEQWELRFSNYTKILTQKDKVIGDIQEKRVELATMSVEAITKNNDRLDDLIELFEDAVGGDGD
jgi:hypothetical protein